MFLADWGSFVVDYTAKADHNYWIESGQKKESSSPDLEDCYFEDTDY